MKLVFIDVETGGLDRSKHALLQLAGAIEIDGKITEEFNYKIQPFAGQFCDKKALEVNKITPEEINGFMEPTKVFLDFNSKLEAHISRFDKYDKAFFVGYNSRFDEDFLRQFFINAATNSRDREYGNGYGNFFWTPSVCVMQMATVKLMHERHKLPNFHLQTVCEYFGITQIDWHDAQADINATMRLYRILKGAE